MKNDLLSHIKKECFMRIIPMIPLLLLILSGCSGDLVETKVKEINSGTYKLSGTQIKTIHVFPWGEDNEVISSDTTQIEFTVEVEYPEGKQDTVRFEGLEGANAGEFQAVNKNCTHPSCYADAKLNSTELKFDLSAPVGAYTGHGYLGAETLILEAKNRYRGDWVYYDLQGEKVEE